MRCPSLGSLEFRDFDCHFAFPASRQLVPKVQFSQKLK
jgi:hypothetical protein